MCPRCCVFPVRRSIATATAGSVVLLSPRMITAAAGVARSIAATGSVVLLSNRTITSAAGVAAVSKSIAATAAGSVACAATDGFQDDSSSKWWTW